MLLQEILTPSFLLSIFSILVTGGTVYGAIKSDLKMMMKEHDRLSKEVSNINERVYAHLIGHEK